jgi:hypothetical protein
MSNENPTQAVVRRGLLKNKSAPECMTLLETVCTAGTQCPEVQASPAALPTLEALKKAVGTWQADVIDRQMLAQALLVAIKSQHQSFEEVKAMLATYEAAINALAKGNAVLINKAGLQARDQTTMPTALDKVPVVHGKPGTHRCEAILAWPPGPGATSYAIEVNFAPQDPSAPWTALTSGTNRQRTVKGPTPGCQFLARVASLAADGTQSAWSDAILATAR